MPLICAMQTFTLDIEKFVNGSKSKLDAFCSLFIQNLNNAIIQATPVDTGFLRASWHASLDAPPATPPTGETDKSGTVTIARLNMLGAQMKAGRTYFLRNGAAYAMRLEFGFVGTDSLGRKINQPPRAFVRRTMARANTIARRTVAEMGAMR